jgi:hypothetical protein
MSWIKLSEEIQLRLGERKVSIRIQEGPIPMPVVEAGGQQYLPSAWNGSVRRRDSISQWEYQAGPVRTVLLWWDREGVGWLDVHWRF